MATIKDVAKAANCSISTVSYAINNDKRIPEVTASRIKEIANEIGYFPMAAARNLKKRNTDTILIAISNFGGPVYHALLDGLQFELANHKYTMIVSTGVSSENLLKERSADGAVVTDIHISDETLIKLAKNFRPIIVLDRNLKEKNIFNMTIDNHYAMYSLTKEILKKNYEQIAFVHGVKDTYDNETRFSGFKQAMSEQKQPIFAEYIGNFTMSSGATIAKKIIDSKEKMPKMFVCANDEMAIGMMEMFQANGYKVPRDFGVSGFDDIELASYFYPTLSTIKINHFDWGKKIADTLISTLKHEDILIEKQHGELKLRNSF